jgi:TPR repeat protein
LVEGKGIKKSYRLAARFLKEYIQTNPYNAKKHQLLGECYEHGVGGRNSRKLAIYHYQEASDFGSKSLAKLYSV